MTRTRSTITSFAILLLINATACDSPSAPNQPVPTPEPTYDLLYASLLSASILVQPFEGGPPVLPGFGITDGFDPVTTRDGRYLAYARVSDLGGTAITVVDRVTGIKTDITTGEDVDEQPEFSPDGSRIAFVGSRDVGSNIYVMNRDGTNRKTLTTEPLPTVFADRSPTWSADGRQLAWSTNIGGFLTIWVMNADGTNKHRLTNSTNAFEDDAAWSPDGTRIAYFEVKEVTPRLIMVNADGSNRQILPTPANGHSRDAAWSPDGKLLAFIFNPDDHSLPLIYTMKPDGSDVQRRSHDDQNRGARRATFMRR